MVCDLEVTIFRSIFPADEALISEAKTSGMTEYHPGKNFVMFYV
jgi:hypothetical protein